MNRPGSLSGILLLSAAFAGLFPGLGSADAAATHARIEITPDRVLEGDPVSIRVTGLASGAQATLHAQSLRPGDDGKPQAYYSEATFTADAEGSIDLATAVPVKGDYGGADLRGLFWSARALSSDPAGGAAVAALHLDTQTPPASGQVVLSLDVDGVVQDRETLSLLAGDPGVVREEVRLPGLIGVFYHEAGAQKRPVVVALSGSEGGTDVADWAGPRLAARGYVVFGIDYFSPPGEGVDGVPTALEGVPVELLEKARDWLKDRPEADVSRFGLLGYSKGAEFTLLLASTYDWVKTAVAYAPSDYVRRGISYRSGIVGSSWSSGGRDLPFLPSTSNREAIKKAAASGNRLALAPLMDADITAASGAEREHARIKLEDSHAALLLVGAGDDQVWDSSAAVARIQARLQKLPYAHPWIVQVYAGAGHELIGTGWKPTTSDDVDVLRSGGTPQADARAQAQAWQEVLAFLAQQL